jgi:hypothetical protein
MTKQEEIAKIIAPLGKQNVYLERNGVTYSVFVDSRGRAQVKPMISVDEAEKDLMMRKLQ